MKKKNIDTNETNSVTKATPEIEKSETNEVNEIKENEAPLSPAVSEQSDAVTEDSSNAESSTAAEDVSDAESVGAKGSDGKKGKGRAGKKKTSREDKKEEAPKISAEELERRSIELLSGHERVQINENIRLFEPDLTDVVSSVEKKADTEEEFSHFGKAEGFLSVSDYDENGERIVRTDAQLSDIPKISTEHEFAKEKSPESDAEPTETPEEKKETAETDEETAEEEKTPSHKEAEAEGVEDNAEEIGEKAADEEEKPAAVEPAASEPAPPKAASAPSPAPKKEKDTARAKKEKTAKPGKKLPRYIDGVFDFIELFVFTLVSVLVVTAFFFRHSVVDGDSMVGTLHDGENLIISNLFYDPEPMDIIVFEDHSTDLKVPVVKRVIAIEGQKVRVTSTDIIVDGVTLDESAYAYFQGGTKAYRTSPPEKFYNTERYPDLVIVENEYYEFTVPEGELFVLGDNRNISHDSRAFGTIKRDSVFGRVLFRFYPFDKFGTVD